METSSSWPFHCVSVRASGMVTNSPYSGTAQRQRGRLRRSKFAGDEVAPAPPRQASRSWICTATPPAPQSGRPKVRAAVKPGYTDIRSWRSVDSYIEVIAIGRDHVR